jgi:acyl carrier protein
MFRTGDLGRFRADGQIDYLGRIDQQVKLRGMRVELGEIEATLEHHPSVKQAVVVLDANSGEPRLVAYAVSRPEIVLVPATLRRFLRQHLPEHMVPAAFVALDALPLMPNGKIDRKRLPAPGAEASTGVPYVAPRTDIEVTIAEIWSQVLHVGRVGAHERFFDLGGHSLLAMQVLARIRNALDVDVSLRALFDDPTVSGLAAAVEEARTGGQRARTPRIVARRSKPNRAALLAQLESMSDEDVDALLEAALARRADAAGA